MSISTSNRTIPDTGRRPSSSSIHLELLYEVSKAYREDLSVHEQIRRSLYVLCQMLGLPRAFLATEDRESGLLRIAESYGLSVEERQRGRFSPGQGTIGQTFKTGCPIVASVSDSSREPLFWSRLQPWSGERKYGFLCVPVKNPRRVLGVIGMEFEWASGESVLELTRLSHTLANFWSRPLAAFAQATVEGKETTAKTSKSAVPEIVGTSPAMKAVMEIARKVARSKVPVLLRGESGTGKELMAHAIHTLSRSVRSPFVKVVCASIPESLFESELFGHERGAFTGAARSKPGLVETAAGGVLFLDEIGDVPLPVQVKLLRLLQEKSFERLGSTQTIKTDARIIAATNQPLEDLVRRGHFREDLYYRLNVIPITLPPLRDRREDIPTLAEYFVERANREHGKDLSLTSETIRLLQAQPWPGNIRELQNFAERLVILSPGGPVRPENLILRGLKPTPPPESGGERTSPVVEVPAASTLRDIERASIIDALIRSGGVQTRAAGMLGVTRRQLGYKISKLGIRRNRLSFE